MYVKSVNKRLLSECYVKIKCLDEETASKYLDELTAYEAILEEKTLNHKVKTADIIIGEAGGGYGFNEVNKEELKA